MEKGKREVGFEISYSMTKILDNISRYSEKDIHGILGSTLGTPYLDYRKTWEGTSTACIPDFPIHIDFELNDCCNQACTMCPRNSKSHPQVRYAINTHAALDFSIYKTVIDEGVSKGLLSVNLGAFAEPLLHPDVFNMVRYAHDRGILDSRVITNGLLLNKFIEPIFDSGLVHLFVSIDAEREQTYRSLRGKGFNIVKSNLLTFLEEKQKRNATLPIVRVSFVDMHINNSEKEDFIVFWRTRVDIVDIQIFDNFNYDTRQQYDKTPHKKWSCVAPWSRVAVLADGTILPCCNFFGRNIPIGNIRNMTIADAWNSDSIRRIREGILDDTLDNCSICQRIGE